MINPNVDASDKELHARNGYKTAGKNLVSFLKNGDQATFARDVFRPARLGDLTKDNAGATKSVGSLEHKPEFKGRDRDAKLMAGWGATM